jgi:hypothetical protein
MKTRRTRGSGFFCMPASCVASDSTRKSPTSAFYLHYFHYPLRVPFITSLGCLRAISLSLCVVSLSHRCRLTISLSHRCRLSTCRHLLPLYCRIVAVLLSHRYRLTISLSHRCRLSTCRHPTYCHCTVVLLPLVSPFVSC